MMESHLFAFLCIFGGVFFCIIKVLSTTTTKNKAAACALWHEHRHWGIGIPEYTFGSTIQARAIPPPSWGSATPVITES